MYIAHSSADHVVHCKKCHAKTGRYHTKEAAFAAWNTRAEPNELPGWIREKIEEKLKEWIKRTPGSSDFHPWVRAKISALQWVLSLKRGE
jgi:hypothetical protein